MDKVRVRFAPSPTGYMHVGNFRTALYAYLFAKKTGGDFLLRIDDTDKDRFVEDAVENIINLLEWAGLDYSEGVFAKSKTQNPNSKQIQNLKITNSKSYPDLIEAGDFGPYIQSERLDLYKQYAEQLIENNTAYRCFCSTEKLEEMRATQTANKQAPMYDRTCLKLSKEEIEKKVAAGEKYVIRQKINTEGYTEYVDAVRGKVSIKNELLDDQILMKSDGYPTYNFANVVDDHLMGITHVIRGEEYVSSTPKYVQLYQNFGWEIPQFAHLPLLLNPDKTKLSKRQGDVAVEDYIKNGYLKEAIINFVAMLGWNPGEGSVQEIFSMIELIEKFDLKKVHKAGAVFDLKKLDWINSQYIKKLSIDELYDLSLEFWSAKEFYKSWAEDHKTWSAKEKEEYIKKVLLVEHDRLNKLSEVGDNNQFFFKEISYDKELLRWKQMADQELKESLEKSQKTLENIEEKAWIRENIEKLLLEAARDKRGDLLWPLRVALTGEQKSPGPVEVAWVLGKNKSIERIKKALEKI